MNRQIGLWSSALTTLATVGFALSMALTWGETFAGWSFCICLALAWSSLVLACAMAAQASDAARAAALAGGRLRSALCRVRDHRLLHSADHGSARFCTPQQHLKFWLNYHTALWAVWRSIWNCSDMD